MKNLIFYKIDQVYFLPYRTVIDKNFMQMYENTSDIISASRIYLICRQQKIRFRTKSVYVKDRKLYFRFLVNGKRTRKYNFTFNDYIKLDKDSLSDTNITFFCNNQAVHFTPEAIERQFGMELINSPEVLYVGMTFNKKNRFEAHSKLLEATTRINDNEDIMVYFLRFRVGVSFTSHFDTNPYNLWTNMKDIDNNPSIQLLERLLINLFKPELNKKHTASDFTQDPLVKQLLTKNSVDYAHIDIGMQNTSFQFWTPSTKKSVDWYYYDFEKNNLFEGLPDMFTDIED